MMTPRLESLMAKPAHEITQPEFEELLAACTKARDEWTQARKDREDASARMNAAHLDHCRLAQARDHILAQAYKRDQEPAR